MSTTKTPAVAQAEPVDADEAGRPPSAGLAREHAPQPGRAGDGGALAAARSATPADRKAYRIYQERLDNATT